MWEISNSLQLLSFAYSVCLGVVFCLMYDVLRAFRRVASSKDFAVFVQDIGFSVIAAFLTFTFLLSVTDGEIRLFALFGIALGFVVARLTVSIIFFRVLKFVFSRLFLLYSLVFCNIYKGFDFLEQKGYEIFKKSGKNLKKLLKRVYGLLYTK